VTPKDVAGVFSRYFIVGFYLPSFFALVALTQGLSSQALPDLYEDYGDGTRIALVGGAALLLGLVVMGLNYQILRWFEGYPLQNRRNRWYARRFHDYLLARQLESYESLISIRDSMDAPDAERGEAAWRLDYRFSEDPNRNLLPTRFGNAIRAFERHARLRWGLNSISAWPRIEMLQSEQQREVEVNARGEVAFFINGCLLAVVAGALLAIDEAVTGVTPLSFVWVYVFPFAVGYAFYRWAIGAAVRWGNTVRASIDMHRLELYRLVGLREPETFTEERDELAPALNRSLLYGDPLPDKFRAKASRAAEEVKEDEDE
jgi:hypothetical protein